MLSEDNETLLTGTSSQTNAILTITLEKDQNLILSLSLGMYNMTSLPTYFSVSVMLIKFTPENLGPNQTLTATLGNDTVVKAFEFTATDEAKYTMIAYSETALTEIKVINLAGSSVISKPTSKFYMALRSMAAGEKLSGFIIYEGSSQITVNFRLEYDKPTVMTANENAEIKFSAENNAEYYSFTATEATNYTIVLTSETDLKNVQVYNAATNSSVVSVTTTSKYCVRITLKLAAEEQFNFRVIYNSNENYPTVNFRVEYDTPTAMTANEDKTIEFSKDNLAEYYTFTATEAGTYICVLTTETDLKNVVISTIEKGGFFPNPTNKYSVARFTMTEGQKYTFIAHYNITAEPTVFPTVNFRIEYRTATELKANEDTEVKFTEEQNAFYLSFTAPEESYYAFVINAEANISNVNIYNAKTNTSYSTVNNVKFFIYNNLKLAAEEKVTFLIYFDGAENYPTFKFRVEYDTPKAFTVNTAEKITFSKTNNVEYYSFTATEDATYALVLTSETSLKNVTVVNIKTNGNLLAITTDDKAKILISSSTKLSANNTLNLAVLYKGDEAYPVVNLTMVYNKPTEMAANKDTTVKFGSGIDVVKYLSFTAAEAGQYALQLTSDTSLKNIQVYNGTNGSSIINIITKDDKANVLVSSVTKFTQDGKLVLAVVYNGAESYPTITVKMIKEEAEALSVTNTITFAAGTHVKTVSYSAEKDGGIVLRFTSESGLTDIKVYNGTTGSALTLSSGKTATQNLTAGTPFVVIITYTGSTELKLTVNIISQLSAPENFKVECYNLLTWDAVEGATKYKVSWKGQTPGLLGGSVGNAVTNKLYYNITSEINADDKGYVYSIIAVDDTGNYVDSKEVSVEKSALTSYITKTIKVTVEVPEDFPSEIKLLKLQTSSSQNFATTSTAAIIEVNGKGSFILDKMLASGNYLRIDPSSLPEGFTCEVVRQSSPTLTITKAD